VLPVGWLVLAVVVAVLLSMWVTFTATRLDRLHARVDAARAALDAQLVRRAAALLHVAETGGTSDPAAYERIAEQALSADDGPARQAAENRVGRGVAELLGDPAAVPPAAAAELAEAAARVRLARRFYNDAVRDTRTLRARRMPRLLRLAGHAELPSYFDIDDTVPEPSDRPTHPATSSAAEPSREEQRAGRFPRDL
jgi:hypothetical protein